MKKFAFLIHPRQIVDFGHRVEKFLGIVEARQEGYTNELEREI
jgi:hypothetical protein